MKKYRNLTDEERATYHKSYYETNKEKIKANSRKHYYEHKEHALQVRKDYYTKNKENINKYRREYWHKNKEQLHKKQRAYNKKHKREIKNYHLKRYYGITIDDYDFILIKQNGGCAICGDGPKHGKYLHVDHDHETKKVRALLCDNCNVAIGHAREDVNILQKMIEYINYHKANNADILKEIK